MPPSWDVLSGLARTRRLRLILRVLNASERIFHCARALLRRLSGKGDNGNDQE
jgi:hypothetical protein